MSSPEPQGQVFTHRGAKKPQAEEISLLRVLAAILRSRKLLYWCVIAATVVGTVVSFLLPVRYTAVTSLLPPQQGSSAGSALSSQLGSLSSIATASAGASLGLKNPNDLQVSLLRSRVVEDAMIARFQLLHEYKESVLSDARKKFEKEVDIENGAKDGLIRVSITDSDPTRAAAMANAYVEEYKRRTAGLAVTEASQRRLFFEEQLTQVKDSLSTAEEELKQTEQRTGVIQLDSQARAAIEMVAQLRAQASAKEVQISAMRSFATESNPNLRVAEQELSGIRAQLAKVGADTSRNSSGTSLPNGMIQGQGLDYIRKVRNVKYYETIFDILARQYELAKVDEARQGAQIQVVDPAIVPDRRSSIDPLLVILAFAATGLFVGIGWLSAKEIVRLIATDPDELDAIAELRRAVGLGHA